MVLTIYNLKLNFPTFSNFNLKINKLEISEQSVLGVVGESGSGKSLTAYAIMNLLPKSAKVTTGEIIFNDKNHDSINLLKSSTLSNQTVNGRKISMVFQDAMTSLNPSITCGKQVDEISRLHLNYNRKKAKEWTKELFEKVKVIREKIATLQHVFTIDEVEELASG